MAQPREIFRDANERWRDCETSKFVPAPDESAEGPDRPVIADTGLRNLTELREAAMSLSRKLRRTMQPKRKKTKKPKPPDGTPCQTAQDGQTDEKPKTAEPPADIARLLGRNDGVIDGFATLAQLVIRLFDKEKEAREHAKSTLPTDEFDAEELDRRIAEELDRIAERRRAADALEECAD